MEKNLEKIFETDRMAREKVSVEKERLAMIEEEISAEKAGIDRNLQEKAERIVEDAKCKMETMLQKETKRIDRHFEDTESSLKSAYETNHKNWANEIFEKVTK